MTLYEVLELNRTAAQHEIKNAFRRLAKQFHPDVSKEPNAHERFCAVYTAYDILCDREKRDKYDRYLGSIDERSTPFEEQGAFVQSWQAAARKDAEQYANMSYKDFVAHKFADFMGYVFASVVIGASLLMTIVGLSSFGISAIPFSLIIICPAIIIIQVMRGKMK